MAKYSLDGAQDSSTRNRSRSPSRQRRERSTRSINKDGRTSEDGKSTRVGLSVTLNDPDLLDCTVCFEPLAPPVYQCDNGHIACSSCCLNMKNICPFCQMSIGYRRCRPIENVVKSVTLSCKNAIYGCQEALSYGKKSTHEDSCIYAPFKCPFPDCGFSGLHENFKLHLSIEHGTPVVQVLYNSINHVSLKETDKLLFLQEETEGNMFMLSSSPLNNGSTHVGNVVAINSIWSSLSDKEFRYELHVYYKETGIHLVSTTNRIQYSVDESPVKGHLFLPAEVFNSSGMLMLKLTFWRDGRSSMHI